MRGDWVTKKARMNFHAGFCDFWQRGFKSPATQVGKSLRVQGNLILGI